MNARAGLPVHPWVPDLPIYPTVPVAETASGRSGCFGTTSVSGPGQKRTARVSAMRGTEEVTFGRYRLKAYQQTVQNFLQCLDHRYTSNSTFAGTADPEASGSGLASQ